jgi:excisionase family DNA binding protein
MSALTIDLEALADSIAAKVADRIQQRETKAPTPEKTVLTTKEAAEFLNCSTTYIRQLMHRDDCDFYINVGRTKRILAHKFYAWLDKTGTGER